MYTRPISKIDLIEYLKNENENLLILKPEQLVIILQDILQLTITQVAAEQVAEEIRLHHESQHPQLQEATQLIREYIMPCLYHYSILHTILFGFVGDNKDNYYVFEQIRLEIIRDKRYLLYVENKISELMDALKQDGFIYLSDVPQLFYPSAMRVYLAKNKGNISDIDYRQSCIKLFRENLNKTHSAYPKYSLDDILIELYKKPMTIGQIPLLEEQLKPLLINEKSAILSGYTPSLSKKVKKSVGFEAFSKNHDKHPDYDDSDAYYYKMLVATVPKIAHQKVIEWRAQLKQTASERLQWFKDLFNDEAKTLLLIKDPLITEELLSVMKGHDELYISACADLGCKAEKQFKLYDRALNMLVIKGLSNHVGLFAIRNKVHIPSATMVRQEGCVFSQ
jgi:hypothetical protein